MLALFSDARVHVLLVDAEGATLFLWKGRQFIEVDKFLAEEDDFDRFHVYFEMHPSVPCVVIADLIEEDFRIETAVHVTGSDRSVLLTRRMNLLFRTSQYRIARVVGRETTGRKDDRVLFTALTKPDIIEPWISRLLKNRVSISAITSAAYVMESFAQAQGLRNQAHTLLVNYEASSGLRQTYLQKGRVIFSRLTRTEAMDNERFAGFLLEQCDQTRKYLERIRQLPYDRTLDVHVFTAERFTDTPSLDHEQLHFYHYAVDEMRLPAKLKLLEGIPGALAYAMAQALRKGGIPNVYAPFQIRRYSVLRRASNYLYGLSALTVLCVLIYLSPTLFSISELVNRETEMNIAARPLLDEYQRMRDNFPETPIQSGQMELVVSTYEAILGQRMDVEKSLRLVSEALTASPELVLTGVEWKLVNVGESQDNVSIYGAVESEDEALQRGLVNHEMKVQTRVSGLVESATSYRQARAMIDAFANALGTLTGSPVTPVEMPMDVSVDTLVSTVVDGRDAAGVFVLEFLESFEP